MRWCALDFFNHCFQSNAVCDIRQPCQTSHPASPSGSVFVKIEGSNHTFEFYDDDKVANLKEKIFERCGISVDRQILKWTSHILRDDLTLAHYQIGKESTHHLIFHLLGGTGSVGACTCHCEGDMADGDSCDSKCPCLLAGAKCTMSCTVRM
jgi:hypothetical protein